MKICGSNSPYITKKGWKPTMNKSISKTKDLKYQCRKGFYEHLTDKRKYFYVGFIKHEKKGIILSPKK